MVSEPLKGKIIIMLDIITHQGNVDYNLIGIPVHINDNNKNKYQELVRLCKKGKI